LDLENEPMSNSGSACRNAQKSTELNVKYQKITPILGRGLDSLPRPQPGHNPHYKCPALASARTFNDVTRPPRPLNFWTPGQKFLRPPRKHEQLLRLARHCSPAGQGIGGRRPPDFWCKGRCSLYIGCPTLVPSCD